MCFELFIYKGSLSRSFTPFSCFLSFLFWTPSIHPNFSSKSVTFALFFTQLDSNKTRPYLLQSSIFTPMLQETCDCHEWNLVSSITQGHNCSRNGYTCSLFQSRIHIKRWFTWLLIQSIAKDSYPSLHEEAKETKRKEEMRQRLALWRFGQRANAKLHMVRSLWTYKTSQ